MTVPEAIAHQEGWYELGSRPRRNLNPGDLIYGAEAIEFGATGTDGEFGIFPNTVTGWRALVRWLSVPAKFHQGPVEGLFLDPNGTTLVGGYLGATMAQVIYRFAPPSQNNTASYVSGLCQNADVTPGTILTVALLQTPEAA